MGNKSRARRIGTALTMSGALLAAAGMHGGLHAATLPPSPPPFRLETQAVALSDGLHLTAMLANATRASAALRFRGRERVVFWATTETGCVIWRGESAPASGEINAMLLSDSETKTFSSLWSGYPANVGARIVVVHARSASSPAINATDLVVEDRGRSMRTLPPPGDMSPIPPQRSACPAPTPTPLTTPTPDASASPAPAATPDALASPGATTQPGARPAIAPAPGTRRAAP